MRVGTFACVLEDSDCGMPEHSIEYGAVLRVAERAPMNRLVVLGFVREAAVVAGCDPIQFDSHSLRIGGATDLHNLLGCADAERMIQKW